MKILDFQAAFLAKLPCIMVVAAVLATNHSRTSTFRGKTRNRTKFSTVVLVIRKESVHKN